MVLALSGFLPQVAPDDGLGGLRNKVIQATTIEEKVEAYKKFFLAVPRSRLADLEKNDEDVGIALQASWQRHRIISPDSKSDVLGNLDRKHGEAFLNAVAARVGVEPPTWWRDSLLAAHIFPGKHTYYPPKGGPDARRRAQILEGMGRLIIDDLVFEGAGFAFDMKCEGKWTARVWAANRDLKLGGPNSHQVMVSVSRGRLVVFGGESHGMYVEAFNVNTGAPIFRFSTCCWFHFPEAWGFQ